MTTISKLHAALAETEKANYVNGWAAYYALSARVQKIVHEDANATVVPITLLVAQREQAEARDYKPASLVSFQPAAETDEDRKRRWENFIHLR